MLDYSFGGGAFSGVGAVLLSGGGGAFCGVGAVLWPGDGAFSGVGAGGALGWMETSSTSKSSVGFGPIGPPGVPRSPYAVSDGTKSCHLEPTGMRCSAPVPPVVSRFTGQARWRPG